MDIVIFQFGVHAKIFLQLVAKKSLAQTLPETVQFSAALEAESDSYLWSAYLQIFQQFIIIELVIEMSIAQRDIKPFISIADGGKQLVGVIGTASSDVSIIW